MFLFQEKENLDRVLLLRPWSFGLRIGESLGLVEKVDVDEKGFCLDNNLRISVSMDISLLLWISVSMNISLLLCQGRFVRMGDLLPKWVDFRYERLPIFCYWCGVMDHDKRDCMLWMCSKESLRAKNNQYGP